MRTLPPGLPSIKDTAIRIIDANKTFVTKTLALKAVLCC